METEGILFEFCMRAVRFDPENFIVVYRTLIQTGARGREEGQLQTSSETETWRSGFQECFGGGDEADDHASCLSRGLTSVGEERASKGKL
jgi:hypothetical protein